MKSILDPTFRYTPSVQTDIRKTFARIRREAAKAAPAPPVPAQAPGTLAAPTSEFVGPYCTITPPWTTAKQLLHRVK